jgi:predicted small metal-binding protein
MTRELQCRDVGFDCDAVVVADNDEDIVRQVAEHARDVHGLTDEQLADPALLEMVGSQIHDQQNQA